MTGTVQTMVGKLTSPSVTMPADPNKIAISVRADPEQHAAWVEAARREERSLAQWMARACNVAAGYVPPIGKPTRRKPRRKPRR
jgi:hypothetical protein